MDTPDGFVERGNGDVDALDSEIQDYSTDEDYNDVFDATANGTDVDAATGSKSNTLKFVRGLGNITKDAGGVAHMRCEVIGDPQPIKIRWYKNEAPLEENRPKITIRKIHAESHEHAAKNVAGSRLKIINLDVSDVGFYACRVSNGKDKIESEGTLRVDSSKSAWAEKGTRELEVKRGNARKLAGRVARRSTENLQGETPREPVFPLSYSWLSLADTSASVASEWMANRPRLITAYLHEPAALGALDPLRLDWAISR
ncbi:hypothetical protein KM043_001303 [Ampulex compressa]|nr:hypothetical protein KM043_001303 [Ampulex compressa]